MVQPNLWAQELRPPGMGWGVSSLRSQVTTRAGGYLLPKVQQLPRGVVMITSRASYGHNRALERGWPRTA